MMTNAQRNAVLAVAAGWLGTPYHPMGRVKGVGVDCLTLLAEVYAEAGIIARPEIPYYPEAWHLHRGQERYLEGVLSYARECESPPKPGDIAVWKFGRCFSHGAIVTAWPEIIHAYLGQGVIRENAETAQFLRMNGEVGRSRPVRFFEVRGDRV